MKAKYPDMIFVSNCIPGSPSELFSDCMLCESTQTMSDADFAAGKALGSAMSSMDYFQDHDQKRWTRQMMNDLARGCSFGAPSWVLITPPEANYISTWTKFLDFSGRTTRLPAVSNHDAISSLGKNSNISGTVWSNSDEFMAAVYDCRTDGAEMDSIFSLVLPKQVGTKNNWQLTLLSDKSVSLPESGWKAKTQKGRLIISGPLASGEMVLVESTK
jgi:hypothetical protein